jgi:fructan beta-fructosidase
MKVCISLCLSIFLLFSLVGCREKPVVNSATEGTANTYYQEPYLPQYHFTPEEKWMNDPNGLVYSDGLYHLFYQYYPADIVWGPMHWGHAVSKDLVFWEHRPIALFPDENGYIFSGSAVFDEENTSGFGTRDDPPLVAVFTYHNADSEKEGQMDYQTQGIAYSTDNGQHWTKYEANPVLANDEGIRDFRDPKVFWHQQTGQWIMALVAGDHARFYSSGNLRDWEYLSSFGQDRGAHGGVWECPDLFPLRVQGGNDEKWVLIISINPGAPNGGSGTQYFIGDFDGTTFSSDQQPTRWIDWGTDNYAGVTYNNVPSGERIFIGWMSNWAYATTTPTESWRSAMTVPRKLSLRKTGETYMLSNEPITDLGTIFSSEINKDFIIEQGGKEPVSFDNLNQAQVLFSSRARDFSISFTNTVGDTLRLVMDGRRDVFLLDRSKSGLTEFNPDFAAKTQQMPIDMLPEGDLNFRILMDWSSVELFLDNGLYAMTSQVFPKENYNQVIIENTGSEPLEINGFEISRAESIWAYTPE